MSDTEITTAAATGAAAAVEAVQDQQETEETVQRAEILSETAATEASSARETSVLATEVAATASAEAAEANQTATMATEIAAGTAEVTISHDERLGRLETGFTEFRDEIRGFFTRLEERTVPADIDEVKQVEVTYAAPENENGQQRDTNSESGRSRRHRFGR